MEPRTTKSEYSRALDLLTRYLALRDHSRFELKEKLTRRFPADLVAKLLTEAEDSGWLRPEEEIAENAARAWQRRQKSWRYIEANLRKRRLPVPARDDVKEIENVRSLVEKKFGDPTKLTFEDRARAYRFLRGRGFHDRMIRMVFDGREQD